MKKLAVLSTAALIGLGSIAATTDAEAGWRGRHRGGAVAAGVIGGLAAGALIGGAIAAQQAPVYAAPAPVYAAPGGDAVAYCMQRFQSYDPQTGTYLGYDGLRHPCP